MKHPESQPAHVVFWLFKVSLWFLDLLGVFALVDCLRRMVWYDICSIRRKVWCITTLYVIRTTYGTFGMLYVTRMVRHHKVGYAKIWYDASHYTVWYLKPYCMIRHTIRYGKSPKGIVCHHTVWYATIRHCTPPYVIVSHHTVWYKFAASPIQLRAAVPL